MEKKIENTAFGLALENGNEEIIDLILLNYSEIDVNSPCSYKSGNEDHCESENPPFFVAVERSLLKIVSILFLNSTIKINIKSKLSKNNHIEEKPPLYLAIEKNDIKMTIWSIKMVKRKR